MGDISDDDLKAFAAKLAGKDTELSEEQRKKLREAFAQIVMSQPRTLVVQARPAAAPVARAVPVAQQEEAPLIPGVGHLSRWIDSKADPEANQRIQQAIGDGPLVPGVGHASRAIDTASEQAQPIAPSPEALAALSSLRRAPTKTVEPVSTVTAVPMVERFTNRR